tara:strand:+ start:174 stop:1214 length:1041 start_codon:yes stop_codon:yes gene_type:complete
MSIFGKVFDVVGDFGSDLYSGAKSAISGFGSGVSNVFSSGVGKGVGNALGAISGPVGTIGSLIGIGGAIGNLVSDKDSGQGSPLGAFTGLQGAPNPVANTSGLGTGSGGTLVQLPNPMGRNNSGSAQSFFPNAVVENQSGLVETNLSSLGNYNSAGFGLMPVGTGLANQAFQLARPFLSNKASQAIGLLGGLATSLIGDDDNNKNKVGGPSFMPDPLISYAPSVQTMPQMQTGNAFFSPVLGRIGISTKGNIIITRRLKNQFKALADNVGLAQASNLAGLPLEIGAMILTKRFATRGKSISTKKMQECARTYKRITNFYNMIPRRTATRTTRAKTMRGASTVIQNS